MQCVYCGWIGTQNDRVQNYPQGVRGKMVPICVDMVKCLERQLANPPQRTEKKILAGVR